MPAEWKTPTKYTGPFMYTDHYKLTGQPFKLTPDARFFFGSRPHKKAMAYLTYGLSQGEGFIVITGDIGTGKSTLIDYLFSQLDTGKFIAIKVVTTHLEADDFLRVVASGLGIDHEGADKATLLKNIESFLVGCVREGRRVLLVVDEVQNLPRHSLEELRMLSNFQLGEHPLLQIYLVGQPQFRRTLADPELEQLRQRVIASHHLDPLDASQTREYIEHRLHMVGWQGDPGITDQAFAVIYQKTDGVPRRINLLCERLLLFGSLEDKHDIDREIVEEVARDLVQEDLRTQADEPGKFAATAAPQKAPQRKQATNSAYATSKSVARLTKRISEVEKRLNGHGCEPSSLDKLGPAVDKLTRAVLALAPANGRGFGTSRETNSRR